jgi:hypothetical protein
MELLASLLRSVADSANVPPVAQVAKTPGMRAVYRLTVRYHDRRAADSVATLKRTSADGGMLEIVYRGRFDHKPLTFRVEQPRYEGLTLAFQRLNFDKLPDQTSIPPHGVDLWLLERAAGSFVKSVILSPEIAGESYAALANTIQQYLPEALREVTL